ncbi:MAG: VWA domain-containing protein [Steroidobacteraceae bacterium]|nr:VWA domain-containing protein [Steroidobacteraceae bacterium]
MLTRFFFGLREAGVPVTLTELLTLLEGLKRQVVSLSAEEFYYFSRACLVKDERYYDRFDRVFAEIFTGAEQLFARLVAEVPEHWLQALGSRVLTEEEKRRVESLGGWEKLMQTLRERLREQTERHEGGNKWIGTGGTSPFGAQGYNPAGVRIGPHEAGNRRAVKVWDAREYRNFDDRVELGTRNLKLALRRLRRFAREGAPDQLDLEGTISATARNAGWLDLKLVPERRNAVKVLLFLDVGGSMDAHVRVCEELFSAARSEFRYLEHFYFHNFPYERLWKDNNRRHAQTLATERVLRTYGKDYRAVFVGDATMSPWEITLTGGSVEHWNAEPGALWMQRIVAAFPRLVWLNPEPPERWDYTPSVQITRELIGDRMFPLTLEGLDSAIRELRRPLARSMPPNPAVSATQPTDPQT